MIGDEIHTEVRLKWLYLSVALIVRNAINICLDAINYNNWDQIYFHVVYNSNISDYNKILRNAAFVRSRDVNQLWSKIKFHMDVLTKYDTFADLSADYWSKSLSNI